MLKLLRGKRILLLFAMLATLLAGCSEDASPLNPKATQGQEQLNLMILSLVIMVIVVVVVFAISVYVLVKFRARKGDKSIPKQVEGNHKLEIIWTVIPIILLTILAVPTVGYTFKHDQNLSQNPDAIKVQVVAHQFWWEFNYPELGIFSAQEVVMPVGKDISFELTSADVNHSFWIPGLGGKKDTNPGLTSYMHLTPMEIGTYKGKCAELCGPSHALMDFKAHVVTEEEFAAWVADMQTPPEEELAEAMEAEDLAAGEALFRENCISCHAIQPDGRSPVAPHLNGFSERDFVAGILNNTEENVKEWIADPNAIKPGTLMPKVDLSEEELDQLTQYLLQLK
ncbi:cytochrome c oxidase subunit II [Paenibacillus sp.]|uniref:cytochrome c oxidase subunit II n=1 Tax=Paenibacillus sp. TaxID=58172 RepID=UPI002D6A7C0B|nr:cytochrome c oxidase subunit II [Paenibacillus sp.]HZG55762.1 cytochrome c oxidase subunit II [Paenibacillus sp.]